MAAPAPRKRARTDSVEEINEVTPEPKVEDPKTIVSLDGKYSMSELHREALLRNRVYLVENIILSSAFFDQLQSDLILTEDAAELVQSEPTTRDKISRMLYIVPRRGPHAFKNFIKVLVVSKQFMVARQIEEYVANENAEKAQ